MSDSALLGPLSAVANILTDARRRSEERAKATHERFNVFTTVLGATDEVRLHTRFLYCLLNPAGLHDCGPLFLDLFFATLKEMHGVDHDGNAALFEPAAREKAWEVEKEASRGDHGKIDLLLETQGFGIAIENKIYAYEQEDQLVRYARYLSDKYGNAFRVIYLTLDGKKSGTHRGIPYLRISYAEHILQWLEKCLCATYHIIPINQVLLQYREVVRHLTGKTLESAAMKPIYDFIYHHPEIIRFRKEIDIGIVTARETFLDHLAVGIIQNLQKEFQVRLRPNLVQGRFGADPNGALIIALRQDSPLRHAPFEIWVEHIAKWNGLMVGIEAKYDKPPLSADDRLLFTQMNLILERDAKTRGDHKADPHELWDGTYWPVGWHDLIYTHIDERLATLIETPLHQTVSKECDNIRSYIRLLEQVYVEAKSLPLLPDAEALP
jgi:PD-(D/E)XK nuclease superfamily